MKPGEAFSVDHEEGELCAASHGAIPHERWIQLETFWESQRGEPEPWDLNDFVAAIQLRMADNVTLTANIDMQFGGLAPDENFLLKVSRSGSRHTAETVADFAVNPVTLAEGGRGPRLRFLVAAVHIHPHVPWEIAKEIDRMARSRKVPVS